MTDLSTLMRIAIEAETPAVLVRVARALGSTPREAGAGMIVTRETSAGTVGGGALELSGVVRAREMLASGEAEAVLAVPLGPSIGQCCGGHVTLALARVTPALLEAEIAADAKLRAARPQVFVFGAGHTGRALALALAPLPLAVRVIDTRREALEGLPEAVEARAAALPEAEVTQAREGSAFLVMTHDHGLDFLLAAAALARGDAAYVGMIGSATKLQTFRRYLASDGREALAAKLTLPIGRPAGGSGLRDKRPEVIAALAAAEVVAVLLSRAEENGRRGLAGPVSRCNSPPDVTARREVRNASAS